VTPARHRPAAEALLHPIVLLALAAWIVNDHWGKAAHPGVLTGKLSDVASLIVAPLLPIAALELWRARRDRPPPTRGWSIGWLAGVGALMVAIKLFAAAAWAYCHGLAVLQWPLRAVARVLTGDPLPALAPVHLAMDPTDLWTLPALAIPALLVLRAPPRAAPHPVSPARPAPPTAAPAPAFAGSPGPLRGSSSGTRPR
jgi:hypothetical protein